MWRKLLKKSACDVIKIRDYPSFFKGFSFPLLLSSPLIFMTSEFFLSDLIRLLRWYLLKIFVRNLVKCFVRIKPTLIIHFGNKIFFLQFFLVFRKSANLTSRLRGLTRHTYLNKLYLKWKISLLVLFEDH